MPIDFTGPYFYLFAVFAFCVGACIGSFLNVCIYRIPIDVSIVKPNSHCAACGTPIPWYYNLPIISWFVLKGRAACCGVRIDRRYWIVEAFTAVLFLAIYLKFHDQGVGVMFAYAVMSAGLIIASGIDMDHFIIPDRFTLGGCVAGMVLSTLIPPLQGETTAFGGFTESLRGAFIAGLVLWVVAQLGSKVFKKEAMGMGDVKFIAAMGAFLGAFSITWIIPISAFLGSFFGIYLIFSKSGTWGTRMPYGPFLALAAILWLFGGSNAMQMYADYTRRSLEVAPMTRGYINEKDQTEIIIDKK